MCVVLLTGAFEMSDPFDSPPHHLAQLPLFLLANKHGTILFRN